MRPCVEDLERDERVPMLGEELAEALDRVLGAGGVITGGNHQIGRDLIDPDLGLAFDVLQQPTQVGIVEGMARLFLQRLGGLFGRDLAGAGLALDCIRVDRVEQAMRQRLEVEAAGGLRDISSRFIVDLAVERGKPRRQG
jgi:hypothetical protein